MNAIVTLPSAAEIALRDQFRAARAAEPGDALGAARDRAFGRFAEAGLPHRRIEAWHYTDLRSLQREALPLAAAPDAIALAAAETALAGQDGAPSGARLVCLDGRFLPALSTAVPEGVTLRPILECLADFGLSAGLAAAERLGTSESIVDLNLALLHGGLVLTVAEGVVVERPIEIIAIESGSRSAATFPRFAVELGRDAKAIVVERHMGLGTAKTQSDTVLLLALGTGAALDHVVRLDETRADQVHLGTVLARLEAEARLVSLTLVTAPGMVRRQSFVDFVGPHGKAELKGVSLLDGASHADTTLIVTHTAPQCESRELYKHVLDGQATGVYQGKVIVKPGAQKTDGKMLSKAVFLGEGPSMFNKPELEIFADDVVCGHGATTGSLDEDQLFYLRSRGLPLAEAQALLLEAFAAEPMDDVATPEIRAVLTESVSRWLRQRGK